MKDEKYKKESSRIIEEHEQKLKDLASKYPEPLSSDSARAFAREAAPIHKALARNLAELERSSKEP